MGLSPAFMIKVDFIPISCVFYDNKPLLNVFTVFFDQFKESSLNKFSNLFQNKKIKIQIYHSNCYFDKIICNILGLKNSLLI